MIWSLISIFGGIFTPVGGGEKGKSYPNWKVEEAKEQVKVVYRSVVEENLSIGYFSLRSSVLGKVGKTLTYLKLQGKFFVEMV